MKIYLNHTTTERGTSATEAMSWHRSGDVVQVLTYDANGKELADVTIQGAAQEKEKDLDENREHCKRIALDVESYVGGHYRRCPNCREELCRDDWDDLEYFKCPHCGHFDNLDEYEQETIWDYMEDILDVDFVINRFKEYKSCVVCVGWGGPNIYIDTDTSYVKLYWGCSYAEYPLSYSARDAIDDWAEEYWGCM